MLTDVSHPSPSTDAKASRPYTSAMQPPRDDSDAEIDELRAIIVALRERLVAVEADCRRRLTDHSRSHERRCQELEATIIALNRRLRRQTGPETDADAPGES